MFGNDRIREDSLNKAIKLYESVLKIYTKDKFKEEYAEVQNKLGIAYYRILDIQKTIDIRNSALNALNEAAAIFETIDYQKYGEVIHNKGLVLKRSSKKNRNDVEESIKCFEICDKIFKDNNIYLYGKNLKELAGAYRFLFEIDAKEEYVNKSIFYAEDASIILNVDEYPFDFADCQNRLGIAYRKLSDLNDRKTNLKAAISHYLQAMNTYRNRRPVEYGEVCNNLGIIYSRLSQICDSEENLLEAIKLYDEAIEIQTDKYPEKSARTKHNLGLAFRRLSKIKDFDKNIHISISCFNDALKIRTKEDFRFQYAPTQAELSLSYIKLSKIKNKYVNLNKAENVLNESFEISDDGEHTDMLGECLRVFGHLYYELSKIENREDYLKKALESVLKSIDIKKNKVNQYQYALNQLQLGRIYCELTSIEDPIGNLERSGEALRNAMEVFSRESCQYYISKTNFYIGNAFFQKSENDLCNENDLLNRSIGYYAKALATIRKDEYPLFRSKVMYKMAKAYSKLGGESDIKKSQELYQKTLQILKNENVEYGCEIVEEKIKCDK